MSGHLHLLSPRGFRAAAVHAGIKSTRAPDVALLVCDRVATAAALFTTNRVVAAPVKIARANLLAAHGHVRAIVVNSGNANACTGNRGEEDARHACSLAASRIGISDPTMVLPCSTGIIGHHLPMQKLAHGVIDASRMLGSSARHAMQFADAILTTDTQRKVAGTRIKIGREIVTIAGVCKGAGMIGPRMHATMLAFLTTDAIATPALLRRLLQDAADRSFNAVTIDDHMSTNDAAIVLASGASGVSMSSMKKFRPFAAALDEVCQSLAYQIAADGEGATKVIRIDVERAASAGDAQRIARAIANSPLVKCAMNGNDPNWGRIVSAAGMCGAKFDPDRATLSLQGTPVFDRGCPVRFDAARVSRSLDAKDVLVRLTCNQGHGSATVWTCDLSKDYVTINADYHT